MTHPLPLKISKELHDHDGDGLLQVDGVVLVHYHWLPRDSQFSFLLLNLLLHPSCKKYVLQNQRNTCYRIGEILD